MSCWNRCFPLLLVAATMTLVSISAGVSRGEESKPTNVLLIMIDDLGWMDLACQGNPLVETPRIDRLAEQGMRFTNAYAAAPVCSPSRAAIMTGQSPARLQITNHIPDRESFIPKDARLMPAAMKDRLDLEYETLPELLKEQGYATAFIGKWHLAGRGDPRFYPEHQGFDINIAGCELGGPPTFFDPYRIPTIKDRKPGEYLPDRLADEAIDFMSGHKDEPFFVCLWNYTVHWPMEAPEALLEKYSTRTGPGLNDTRYGAMIEAMDRSLGRIFDALDELDLAEDTLVIFTSDNGGYGGVSDCRPLRESKGYLYEGGIRVPMIVRWPGQVESGTISDTPVIGMDLYSTIVAIAGGEVADPEKVEGVDLSPVLTGQGGLDRDALFFHYPNYAWHKSNRLGSSVRMGRYKLIEYFDDDSVELYDLEQDLGEEKNLATEQPEVADRLLKRLHDWRADVNASLPSLRE